MAVHVDVYTQLDRSSINRSGTELQRELEQRGDRSGQGFASNFARAIERDTSVRKAAEKLGDSLDKATVAEARRATVLAKSQAISEAVAKTESDLAKVRGIDHVQATEEALRLEQSLTSLRQQQTETNNKLVVATVAVEKAERDRTRAVREAGDAYRQMGTDVDSVTKKLGSMGSLGGAVKLNLGLVGVGALPAAATAITEVAGAVQQLAGAGLAVPGIFAGIAASVGVGALGLNGMADALKAIDKASDGTKTHVDAANKALADLPASSADVVKTVAGLKGTFKDLQTLDSGNMFSGVSDGIKGLVAADLPAVTKGVDGISRGINQNLMQALRSLGSSSSQGVLDRIFGNTADAQSKLTAAIDPAIHAIGTLTAAGTDSLPRLADAVGNVADRFDRFISMADANGNLAKWIDQGLDGFTQLGNTVLNIGRSFTALTEAAGGGAGLLGTLESATGKMADFLNSTEGQSTLKDFFDQGRDTLGQLMNVATSAGPVLAGVFNAGISAANLWLPVIQKALDMINSIPGGVEAVVTAFVAWQSIKGIASVASSLNGIANILKLVIPGAAAEGAAGITSAFAGITLPAWLSSFLAAGGSIAALPAVAAGFATAGSEYYKTHNPGDTNENASARGRTGIGARIANGGEVPYSGGGGPFGGSPGYGASVDPNWSPVLQTGPSKPGTYRTRDGQIRTIPGQGGPAMPGTPDVSSYSAPAITSGGSGAKKPPYIDPSKYMMGDPLAGMPAAVAGSDPAKIYDADSKVITAAHNLEQGRLALQVLEAQGNATQQELLTAKNNLVEQERALNNAQDDDIKARTNQLKNRAAQMGELGVKLDQDLGISNGLAGLADNFVRFIGSLAVAPLEAKLQAISNAPGQAQGGFGLMGILGAQGVFGQQFTAAGQAAASSSASPLGPAALQPPGAYPGDAALLANVPAGRYTQDQRGDLTQGLADCSSAVEDLVNLMDGRSTAGASMSTGNEAAWLTQHGFSPGMGGPGDFRVGFNNAHTQATLPGGTPFNWGSDAAAARGGVGGTGADDPAFTSHYYRPVGATSGGPVIVGAPSTGAPAAPSPFGGVPIPLPVTIVGGGGGWGGPPAGAPAGAASGDPYSPSNTSPGLNNPPAPGGSSGPGWFPSSAPAPGGPGWGSPGIPDSVTGGGGQGPVLGASPQGPGIGAAAGGPGAGPTQIGAAVEPGKGSGAGGIGMTPGGLADSAISAAAAGLDVMAPGAGQAAQVAVKLANRAIQYGGQVAAIGAQGLMDTFLPTGGSDLAKNSWVSKIAGGIAGAAPALPNMAGKGAPPKPDDQGQGGAGQAAGQSVQNINVTNNRATEDGTGKDIAYHAQSAALAPAMP